jgi:hypothetical protein
MLTQEIDACSARKLRIIERTEGGTSSLRDNDDFLRRHSILAHDKISGLLKRETLIPILTTTDPYPISELTPPATHLWMPDRKSFYGAACLTFVLGSKYDLTLTYPHGKCHARNCPRRFLVPVKRDEGVAST